MSNPNFVRSFVSTVVVILSCSQGCLASIAADVPRLESLLDEYVDFLGGLTAVSDIDVAEADFWISSIRDEIEASEHPLLNQSGWEVIISLYNVHARWESSLAACDAALATATTDQAVFDRLRDRLAVMAAWGDSPRAVATPAEELSRVRLRMTEVYGRLWGDEGDRLAVSRWPAYMSAAWDVARGADQSVPVLDRIEVLRDLLARMGDERVQGMLPRQFAQNARGTLAALLLARDHKSIESAAGILLREEAIGKPNSVAFVVALQVAGVESVPLSVQNSLLWECEASSLPEREWLTVAVAHIAKVLHEAEAAGEVVAGVPSVQLRQIPINNLIDLIEPTVNAMLGRGYGQAPAFQAPLQSQQDYVALKSASWLLAELYEMAGDQSAAEMYRSAFRRTPFEVPEIMRAKP